MTELYPYIGPDMTYDEQRKSRMQDCIDDYLQDNEVSARRTYEEILSCVQDVIDYHEKECLKAKELYDLMLGNRWMNFHQTSHMTHQQDTDMRLFNLRLLWMQFGLYLIVGLITMTAMNLVVFGDSSNTEARRAVRTLTMPPSAQIK